MIEYRKGIFQINSTELGLISPLVAEFREYIDLPFNPAILHEKMGSLMSSGSGHVLVSKVGDEVVGFIAFQISEDLMSPLIFSTELGWWIDPDHRGGSAAGRLFKAFEDFSLSQGAERLTMVHLCDENEEKLSKLYKKKGFRPLEKHYIR